MFAGLNPAAAVGGDVIIGSVRQNGCLGNVPDFFGNVRRSKLLDGLNDNNFKND
jgi:hypothetical protein